MNVMEARRRTLGGGVYEKTVSGETVLANGSLARRYPGIHLYGQSTQASTTGAQLLNYLSIEGSSVSGNATATIDDDGYINISGNGNNSVTRFNISPHIPVGEYTISIDNPIDITFGLTSDNGDYANGIGIPIGNTSASKTTADEVTQLVFSTAGKEEFAYKLKIMLNAGTTALPWEPYTGGAPSPSPDYPQEIVSKAEDGNVEVEVLGGNLYSEGDKENLSSSGFQSDFIPWAKKPTIYFYADVLSDNPSGNVFVDLYYYNDQKEQLGGNGYLLQAGESYSKGSLTISGGGVDLEKVSYIKVQFSPNSPATLVSIKNIVVTAKESLEFTGYYTPQTLTVSTPNGLPGIPVTSGGNYTDETGQQWVCDEVDFKRGVYVQRVGRVTFDGSEDEGWWRDKHPEQDIYIFRNNANLKNGNFFINNFLKTVNGNLPKDNMAYFDSTYFGVGILTIRYDSAPDDDAFRSFLTENNIVFMAQANEPTETPLTPAELSAYAGLHTNNPTTTVINDEGVYMSLDYKTKKSLEVN